MKINWVTLKVRDLDASRELYEDCLGLDFVREFTTPDGRTIAFFEAENGMEIELIGMDTGDTEHHDRISIGMEIPNFDEILDEARRRELMISGPMVLGGSVECFFMADLDGNMLQIIRG